MNRIYLLSIIIILLFFACARLEKEPVRIDQEVLNIINNNWQDLISVPGIDSTALEQIRNKIRFEADSLATISDPRALYTARDGFLLIRSGEDSIRAEEIAVEIRRDYPASRQTWHLAEAEFYDKVYPVWDNDSLKIEIIGDLIAKYPRSGWRRVMYPYLTYSLDKEDRLDELKQTLHYFRKAFVNGYLSWYQSAYYYEKNDLDLNKALEFAEKSYSRTRDYPYVDFYPTKQWQLEKRGALVKTSAQLAAILCRMENYSEVIQLLKTTLHDHNLTVEDEITLARVYYYLGVSYLEIGDHELAVDMFLEALKMGDTRNHYTPKADSLLKQELGIFNANNGDYLPVLRQLDHYQDVCFSDVSEEYGVGDIQAGRIAWGDFDRDGFQDILLNGSTLLHNIEGRKFIEVTDMIPSDFGANGGLWGDLDNDGDLDIVTKDPEAILLNQDSLFILSVESNVKSNQVGTEGIGLGDFNRDGYLDIYYANYESEEEYFQDQYYKSQGYGVFEENTDKVGLNTDMEGNRAGRGVNPADFDNDGDLDIYVSNYRLTDNFLWLNNGKGRFSNKALDYDLAGVEIEGWWGHTIGSEWADWDNDGDLDLLTANLAHPRYIDVSDKTMLYENSGAPEYDFKDIRSKTGIRYAETHSEPAWGDLNNDGFLDLYINNVYEGRRSFLYMNEGNGTFRDVTFLAGVRHFNGWGVAFADIDNDGDLDILAAGDKIQLFRNDSVGIGNWLEVEIYGETHFDAIGSRLELYNEKILLLREIQGGKGTTNQHSLVQHFGLGNNNPPFTLKIRFPSGKTYSIVLWEVNKRVIINEKNL